MRLLPNNLEHISMLPTLNNSVFHWYDGHLERVYSQRASRGITLRVFTVVTNDKDFGGKVFRDQYPHHGIVILRLDDERASNKISVMKHLLSSHAQHLTDRFVVVTERLIRFAQQ